MVSGMASHVTRLALTTSETPSRMDITAVPGMPQWRVTWTLSSNGRDREWGMSHYTENAARRHFAGL